jgi:hypothetical protein
MVPKSVFWSSRSPVRRSPLTEPTIRNGVYAAVADRHTTAAVTVLPCRTAAPSGMVAIACTQHDPYLRCIAGRAAAWPGRKPSVTTGAPFVSQRGSGHFSFLAA